MDTILPIIGYIILTIALIAGGGLLAVYLRSVWRWWRDECAG